jgi:carbon storage regulator
MLVLTRKADQELVIDGQIRVRVLSIDGGRVRLGIVAPRSVPVTRTELMSQTPSAARSTPAESSGWTGSEVNHGCIAIV